MHTRLVILLFFLAHGLFAQQDEELRMSIYFGGGSYYIDDEQTSDLTHWLDSIPNLLEKYQIQLTSHTDPVGGKEFNELLSRLRSQAVLKLLLENSIPENLIHVKDWDYENAVYDNNSYVGRALNRRVDIVLHPIVF